MAKYSNRWQPSVGRRFLVFHLLWSVGSVVLMASTWRLWVGTDQFPQIPLWSIFVGSPRWIDYIALALCGAACLLTNTAIVRAGEPPPQVGFPLQLRLWNLVWAAALLFLFLTNQHRLQPWAWQFFIFALLVVLGPTQQSVLAASRAVVVSIYVWSAIGKFDFQFLNGLGRQFASATTGIVGFSFAADQISPWVVLLMPAGELLVGILLLFSVVRRSAVVAAIALHLGLVVILGPWGMDHHAGVVIWNLFFAMITAVLFWPPKTSTASQTPPQITKTTLSERGALWKHAGLVLFTATVLALPLHPSWDHWLAWGLYAPNNRRCTLKLIAVTQQDADPSLKPYLVADTTDFLGGVDVLKVDLGRMSLDLLDTPIYPEARMQLGVTKWIEKRFDLDGRAVVTIQSKSDRFTGARDVETIDKRQNAGQTTPFFFNHLPR